LESCHLCFCLHEVSFVTAWCITKRNVAASKHSSHAYQRVAGFRNFEHGTTDLRNFLCVAVMALRFLLEFAIHLISVYPRAIAPIQTRSSTFPSSTFHMICIALTSILTKTTVAELPPSETIKSDKTAIEQTEEDFSKNHINNLKS
jgi:hypothetical protein